MSRAIINAFRMCSRKVRYATAAVANKAQPSMRHYHCPICAGWHATSPPWMAIRAEKRRKRRIRERIFGTPIPLTGPHGAAGDPPTGRHNNVHRMKHGQSTPHLT